MLRIWMSGCSSEITEIALWLMSEKYWAKSQYKLKYGAICGHFSCESAILCNTMLYPYACIVYTMKYLWCNLYSEPTECIDSPTVIESIFWCFTMIARTSAAKSGVGKVCWLKKSMETIFETPHIRKICTIVCCAMFIHDYNLDSCGFMWYISPYLSGLFHWHNLAITPIPAK